VAKRSPISTAAELLLIIQLPDAKFTLLSFFTARAMLALQALY